MGITILLRSCRPRLFNHHVRASLERQAERHPAAATVAQTRQIGTCVDGIGRGCLFLYCPGIGGSGRSRSNASDGTIDWDDAIAQLVSIEEIILDLEPQLRSLERNVLNLQIPSIDAAELFESQVTLVGQLARAKRSVSTLNQETSWDWTITKATQNASRMDLKIWERTVRRMPLPGECRVPIRGWPVSG